MTASLPILSAADARAAVRLLSGTFDPARRTLFSVFRDEMYFAPAFLDHYRGIGVRQFLILDDGSIDGTREFLAAQPDCVLLASELSYGQPIVFVDPAGRRHRQRAGIFFKMAVPPAFVSDDYVLYLDADEFLLLPPGVSNVETVVARLRASRAAGCVAAIAEFFPDRFSALREPLAARTLGDLIARYGHFQAEPVAEVDARGFPAPLGPSKSTKLFRRYGIRTPQRGLRKKALALFRPEYRKSPQFKTPIYLCDGDAGLAGTHALAKPAAQDILLTVAHFVFTSQLEDKISRALEWRSYVNGSDKYEHYARLFRAAGRGDDSLLDEASARFTSADQLIAAGLMRW